MITKFDFNKRPLSWSAISSFEYSPEQWYKNYVLHEARTESLAMVFGKKFAKSIEEGKPLAPVEVYSEVEYPLDTTFNGIKMCGYVDTYEPHTKFREYKTARQIWTREKALTHGQLKMYALMIYLIHKVKPEDLQIHLDCIQTRDSGNFEISFIEPIKVHSFEVKLTMKDILLFGAHIMRTTDNMQRYIKSYPLLHR